jgi:hypothetical protein
MGQFQPACSFSVAGTYEVVPLDLPWIITPKK